MTTVEFNTCNSNNKNNISTNSNGKNSASNRNNRQRYKLSSAEMDLLLFFVDRKVVEIPYHELRKYLVVDIRLMDNETYHTVLASLISKGIISEIPRQDYTTVIRLSDIPALIKIMLNFKYYTSAVILTALIQFFSFWIKKDKECKFSLHDFVYSEDKHAIRFIHRCDNRLFKDSVHELVKRGYLAHLRKDRYLFEYKNIPESITNLVLRW